MKRFGKWAVATALMATCATGLMAEDIAFVGAEVKYHAIEAQEPATRKSFDDNTVAVGLKVGAQNEKFRVALMYDLIPDTDELGGDISQYLLLGTLDYFFPIQHPTFKPYFGLALGYGEYEFEKASEDDFVYGMQAGLVYNLNRHLDLDLFGRYLWPNHDTVDDYLQAGIGINYKF